MNANSTDPMIGRLIDGRYQVRSRIARGGMATVYLATDLRLERRVAIKVMHGHLADDSKFKERFIQEARSAARLAHPNVVNVFDQGQDSDMAYLVMEYLPGITLRDLLQEHGRLTTEQTLDVLEAVLSGLSAAHKAGIVHRDLKPENVLLADDGRIKIGDFGLARAASANTATGAALLGTIAYLSPELVTRGVADTRSDIYAVGIMMYEMLTGEQPFKGEQPMQIAYQHANDSVPVPSNKNARVPAELDELVLWSTAREPDERPRDARVMLEQLLAVQSELADPSATQVLPRAAAATATQRTMVLPGPAPRGSTLETQVLAPPRARHTGPILPDNAKTLNNRSRRRRARGWWLLALVLVVAAAAGGTGWYFNQGPGAKVSVPDVSGASQSAARNQLRAAGFVVATTTTTVTSPTVAKDLVAGTDPSIGSTVNKGSTVALKVSVGPALLKIPTLVGLDLDTAKSTITKSRFTVASPIIRQFDSKVTKNTVIASQGSDGSNLVPGATYPERRAITLVVSAGTLPEIAGKSLSEAISLLKSAGVGAVEGSHVYNDTIPEDSVIGIDPTKDAAGDVVPIRVGDTGVPLQISRGPQLVEVPNVVGMSWRDAKKLLSDAGFKLDYNAAYDIVPNAIRVTSTDPDGGSQEPKGSHISVKASF